MVFHRTIQRFRVNIAGIFAEKLGIASYPVFLVPKQTWRLGQERNSCRAKGYCIMGQRYTLFFTAREGRQDDLQWALVERKISPDLRDPETQQTALHIAAARGRVKCVQLLLEAGASVNAKEKDGLTALHLAVYHGHNKCVKILTEHRADVNCTSRFGSTPLHQAAYFGHLGCAKVLLAAGAMVNVEEAWGQTPLFLAAQRAHSEMVQLLLSSGACVTHIDTAHDKTALQVACEAQSLECVMLLLDAGADPNVQCENGRTPLHEVLTGEEASPIAQMLLEYGARCDIEDKDGHSPMTTVQSLMLRYSTATSISTYCKYQSLLEVLWENHGQPRNLKQLCRCAIRRSLSPLNLYLVQELALPTCLQEYILNVVTTPDTYQHQTPDTYQGSTEGRNNLQWIPGSQGSIK